MKNTILALMLLTTALLAAKINKCTVNFVSKELDNNPLPLSTLLRRSYLVKKERYDKFRRGCMQTGF